MSTSLDGDCNLQSVKEIIQEKDKVKQEINNRMPNVFGYN